MKGAVWIFFCIFFINIKCYSQTYDYITAGTEMRRGYLVDNLLHSSQFGDIHFSSYVPKEYDGSRPYALFITLPGWGGLYFQGIGINIMQEDFGLTARDHNNEMIIIAPQLNDWGETSANQTIALTEYLLRYYTIDPKKVYLEGYSGGGETGSIIIGKRPELYAAFLHVSSKWSGKIETIVNAKTAIYMVTGRNDSYYGSQSVSETYRKLYELYRKKGLQKKDIDSVLVLDLKENEYFRQRGYTDPHAGGVSFAKDSAIMGWLFKRN